MKCPSGGLAASGRLLPIHKLTLKGKGMAAPQAADRLTRAATSV